METPCAFPSFPLSHEASLKACQDLQQQLGFLTGGSPANGCRILPALDGVIIKFS